MLTADQKWLFVPHVQTNAICQFNFDASTGKIARVKDAEGGKEGSGPRHLAIHPSQKRSVPMSLAAVSLSTHSMQKGT